MDGDRTPVEDNVSESVKKEKKMSYLVPENIGELPQMRYEIPRYAPPFPNIRAKRPDLYDAAIRAKDTVEKLKWFKDIYFPLELATSRARLALVNNQLSVIPEESSVQGLLGPKLIQAALKQSGKSLVKMYGYQLKPGEWRAPEVRPGQRPITGDDLGRFLGILDLLWKLKEALDINKRERLVSEQAKSMRDDAYAYKLRFFTLLWIAKNAPGASPAEKDRQFALIINTFWKYKKALGELWKYEDIEKNLEQGFSPYQRRPQTMGPAPPGR
jgi:hypothetical protein